MLEKRKNRNMELGKGKQITEEGMRDGEKGRSRWRQA